MKRASIYVQYQIVNTQISKTAHRCTKSVIKRNFAENTQRKIKIDTNHITQLLIHNKVANDGFRKSK